MISLGDSPKMQAQASEGEIGKRTATLVWRPEVLNMENDSISIKFHEVFNHRGAKTSLTIVLLTLLS